MRITTRLVFGLALALALPASHAWSRIDPEDQRLIDNATCAEIVREHRNYATAEREAAAEIQRSKTGTAAANVAGIAAFATLGFGFFTWDDHSDAEENLAELREIRQAIAEGARKKGCVLSP
jgi:hypothetical protein